MAFKLSALCVKLGMREVWGCQIILFVGQHPAAWSLIMFTLSAGFVISSQEGYRESQGEKYCTNFKSLRIYMYI
jgi:hypothetical protein